MSDELEQRRRDAAVGRAIREAIAAGPSSPIVHVSWEDERGRTRGRTLSDEPLFGERWRYAEAAQELYEAAEAYAHRDDAGA